MQYDKKWLKEKYVRDRLSASEIAKMASVTNVTILNWMRKFGIPIRSASERSSLRNVRDGRWTGRDNPGKNGHPNFLAGIKNRDLSGKRNGMYGKRHSAETIAKITAKRRKRTRLSDEHIEKIRKNTPSGKDSPHWKGGISFGEYSPEWSAGLKRKIRRRDLFTCAVCGKRGFCVHHIDYDKENCSESNLITLCRSCHSKTNKRREYWTNYFLRKIQI